MSGEEEGKRGEGEGGGGGGKGEEEGEGGGGGGGRRGRGEEGGGGGKKGGRGRGKGEEGEGGGVKGSGEKRGEGTGHTVTPHSHAQVTPVKLDPHQTGPVFYRLKSMYTCH